LSVLFLFYFVHVIRRRKKQNEYRNNLRSERQARLEKEKDDMMTKVNKIRKTDFNNTKRIERPEEILERRRKERENRNVWYRRTWRAITFQN